MQKIKGFLNEFSKNPFTAFLHLLTRSNIFISLGAMAASYETMLFLNLVVSINIIIFTGLATLFVYNADRLVLIKYLKSSKITRHEWLVSNKNILWIITGIAFLGMLVFLFSLAPSSWLFLGVLGILSLAYAMPIMGKSLRSVPGLKTILLITVWIGVCFILPILEQPERFYWNEKLLISLLERGFFLFIMAICFDIRDAEQDLQTKVLTLPTIFGVNATRKWCLILLLFGTACCSLIPDTRYLSPIYALFAILIALGLKRGKEIFYGIGIDGLLILRALSLWFTLPFNHFNLL